MIKNKFAIMLSISFMIIAFVSGCAPKTADQQLISECEAACQAALAAGQDLNAGPCLLNPMSNSSWVCDIAHEPRQDTDNLPENQCSEYRNSTATHFIELTPECEVIKSV